MLEWEDWRFNKTGGGGVRGVHSTEVEHLLLTQQPGFRIPAVPKNSEEKLTLVNLRPWLEESGQWIKKMIKPI